MWYITLQSHNVSKFQKTSFSGQNFFQTFFTENDGKNCLEQVKYGNEPKERGAQEKK